MYRYCLDTLRQDIVIIDSKFRQFFHFYRTYKVGLVLDCVTDDTNEQVVVTNWNA